MMVRGGKWLLGLAGAMALFGGCAEVEPARLPTELADTVVLSAQDPGAACCPLESVEVRSRRSEGPAGEALRLYAWRRAANYVVIDTFSILDETSPDMVLLRARLYRCPALIRVQ